MVLSETGLSRRRTDAWFRARRQRPNVYAEVSGHEAVISMVRLGCGVGVVPRLVLERFAQKNEVRELEVSPPLEPLRRGPVRPPAPAGFPSGAGLLGHRRGSPGIGADAQVLSSPRGFGHGYSPFPSAMQLRIHFFTSSRTAARAGGITSSV